MTRWRLGLVLVLLLSPGVVMAQRYVGSDGKVNVALVKMPYRGARNVPELSGSPGYLANGGIVAALEGMGEWMRVNNRSIYGCGAAPAGMEAPVDCRYTYNAETNRLYLHLFAWPFGQVHLTGMAGKVKYAQFLHDASEVRLREPKVQEHANLEAETVRGDLTLNLPVVKPNIEIATIELFLK